jgi:hypothetical protein
MNCERIQNRFLEMDNRSHIPLLVYVHMLYCDECRRLINALNEQFDSIYNTPPYCLERDMCEKIMIDVFRSDVRYEHHVGGAKWAVVGLIILISMFLIPFSDSFGWLKHHFGAGLEVPVSLVLGSVISVYATIGIFSNLGMLKKFVHNLPRKLH